MWSMLGNTIGITFFWWLYIIPFIFKCVIGIVKYSVLNITTWFRGWRPVAWEIAEAGLRRGIATGKYPPNPPEAARSNEFFKANLKLIGGFIVNLYIGVFTFTWVLGLFYS